MSIRTLERELAKEARMVLANPAFRLKDLMEWQTGAAGKCPFEAHEGEGLAFLPELSVWIAFPLALDKRGK